MGEDPSCKELVDAKKLRIGAKEAISIARSSNRVLVARGQKFVDYDMNKDDPDDDVLAKGIIGPSGNLRAPTLKIGKTLIVGFHHDVYTEVLDS